MRGDCSRHESSAILVLPSSRNSYSIGQIQFLRELHKEPEGAPGQGLVFESMQKIDLPQKRFRTFMNVRIFVFKFSVLSAFIR